jgi:Delta-aminolevulinic acid dehydratase
MIIIGKYSNLRIRRKRNLDWSRRLVREKFLSVNDLIFLIFFIDGSNKKELIKTMSEIYRYSVNRLFEILDKAINNKI